MTWTIVGLGNPGDEYANTRHNAGRIILETVRTTHDLPAWAFDKKANALISKGEIQSAKVILVEPETFMNLSGNSVGYFVKTSKAAEKTIVIYDDLDLPLGTYKIAFNRGSGGHKGIESISSVLKTDAYVRIRVGISPMQANGKLKKPKSHDGVHDFIIGGFKKQELELIGKLSKEIVKAIEIIVTEGYLAAMTRFN